MQSRMNTGKCFIVGNESQTKEFFFKDFERLQDVLSVRNGHAMLKRLYSSAVAYSVKSGLPILNSSLQLRSLGL